MESVSVGFTAPEGTRVGVEFRVARQVPRYPGYGGEPLPRVLMFCRAPMLNPIGWEESWEWDPLWRGWRVRWTWEERGDDSTRRRVAWVEEVFGKAPEKGVEYVGPIEGDA